MAKIFELEPHVADLIAAGEVVQRPASVVKELIENSIDAGAGIITVEINAGGMTYIRVSDNGCGISPEDARTAFLRHATSKLRGAGDLEAIGTLGFRGEALAAVAAVSRIELLTREQGAQEGFALFLEAGAAAKSSPAGCPEGTTMIVRDLFFNTPARLKFMKSDRAEGSAAASAVLRCALSHPEVSVRFLKDGKTEYHTPGDSRIDSCIYNLFGRDFAAGLVRAESDDETVAITGYISSPSAARGNRSYQYFFVNGRAIQSKTLQAALEQAYANAHMPGRYPSCVLYLTMKPGNVDVNVHPAKTEVKFVSEKQVFDSVYYTALGALNNAEGTVRSTEVSAPSGNAAGNPSLRGAGASPATLRDAAIYSTDKHSFADRRAAPAMTEPMANRDSQFSTLDSQLNPYSTVGAPELPYQTRLPLSPETEPASREPPDIQIRVIGEALNTYIIAEYRDSVWFIDKHAAHERIHFNALRSDGYEPASQALITPVVCRHGHDDTALLLDNAEILGKLGFTVDSFGADAVAVRGIPAEIDVGDTETVLSEICAQIRLGGTAEPASRDNILRSVACKAAIKAGRASEFSELKALAERVLSGEITHCPHDRPVAFEITKTALDRGFKRI